MDGAGFISKAVTVGIVDLVCDDIVSGLLVLFQDIDFAVFVGECFT